MLVKAVFWVLQLCIDSNRCTRCRRVHVFCPDPVIEVQPVVGALSTPHHEQVTVMAPTTKRRRLSEQSLEDRKARNDQRLKSRFEAIFEKYSQDFTGIGDEIEEWRDIEPVRRAIEAAQAGGSRPGEPGRVCGPS